MRRTVAALTVLGLLPLAPVEARDETLKGWFDLPVAGGVATLAAVGIPLEERALTLSLLARAIHGRETRTGLPPDRLSRLVSAITTPPLGAVTAPESVDIPAPLDAETWRELLALKPDEDLFARFLTDRNALLLAVGLTATDDSVRTLVTRDRELLRFLYREAAGPFVVASRYLRLNEGGIVGPGGPAADAIWESLADARLSRPAAFVRALVTRDQGRLAWYFDTIASLDDERLAVAWPAGPAKARLESAVRLYASFRDADPQWRTADQPFRRNVADAWAVVTMSDVAAGQLAGPISAALWELVFASETVGRDDARRQLLRDSTPLSMASLVQATLISSRRERRNRFEVFRLAQRVFRDNDVAAGPDLAVALSGHGRYRALLLALERMQIANAETWAIVVTAARHVTDEADDEREALASFQGAIALVERFRHMRTIDVATADRVLRTLSEAVQRDRRVTSSIGRWVVGSLVPALPRLERPDAWTRKTAYESAILQSLAGPRQRLTPSIEWEGLTYKVDVVAAEQTRLRAVRLEIPSPGLDAAIESGKPRDLAAALMALVYVASLGDADGAAQLSRDVATRHDFGLGSTSILKEVAPWAPPEERQGLGAWRVQGSLIGLDLGLSRLMLRRVADQQMPAAPTLTLNDFATLTRTVAALVPNDRTDADRDEVAAAIARGRRRVADAGTRVDALDTLAREVRMSAVSRQLLPWMARRHAEALPALFSLRDLLWLGQPTLSRSDLDRWGVAGDGLDGRRVTVMPPPAPWEDFAGRSDAGQITTQVPDLTLRLVEETARLKIPATLIPALLGFAIEEYWHDVQARFPDDWPRMTRQAAALQSSRIEDYVAALAGNGPLRTQ